MRVANSNVEDLKRELHKQIGYAFQLLEEKRSAEARLVAEQVLENQHRVQLAPNEWGLSFSEPEGFLYVVYLLKEGRLSVPEGYEMMVWNPVPVHLAHLVLGSLAVENEQPVSAERELLQSLRGNPVYTPTHLQLSYVYQKLLEKPARALKHAKLGYQHTHERGQRVHALRAAGSACIDLNQFDLARCFYLESLEHGPNSLAESQLNYIRAQSLTGREIRVPDGPGRKDALELLGFAPSVNQIHVTARIAYCKLLVEHAEIGRAIELLEEAVDWVEEPTPLSDLLDHLRSVDQVSDE